MLKIHAFRYRYVILATTVAAFSLDLSADPDQNARKTDVLPISARVKRLFTETKTICVGRFLIDVPQKSEVVYGPTSLPWPIIAYPGKGNSIDKIVAERLSELAEEKDWAIGPLADEDSSVGKIVNGAVPNQKIIFGVSKESGGIYRIDSYIKVDSDLFIQKANPISSRKDETVRELNAIAASLRSRDELEVPTQPGVCIEAGFVSDPNIAGYEALNIGVRLAEFPDVHLAVSVTKKDVLVESDALEPRLRQAEEIASRSGNAAWYSHIKTLRRGGRVIGKWHGFEILAWKPAQAEEGESHEFVFVSQGEPKNSLLPVLEVEFHTGIKENRLGGTKPSVSDDEAVAIWDKLTASIRVRPTDGQ
ncbi:T6SS immunity protein Tli4 family protein [Duganella vulcania]|uniref:Tle cognate immunity protein 4 C-terminal domain-containing protein n=1 Tax=Duganella vulcania TaxID=2692166 RepID=A0A845GKG6_9BURK|nr:T6SS immunity protein Tli4 family protein [Duganella vulcania]MYM95063.1 hypothetical protein [Duganella vulcania]